MTVNFVQLSEQDKNEDSSVPILRALEQIKNYEVDIIVLYIEKQKIELMLQQVVIYLYLINCYFHGSLSDDYNSVCPITYHCVSNRLQKVSEFFRRGFAGRIQNHRQHNKYRLCTTNPFFCSMHNKFDSKSL